MASDRTKMAKKKQDLHLIASIPLWFFGMSRVQWTDAVTQQPHGVSLLSSAFPNSTFCAISSLQNLHFHRVNLMFQTPLQYIASTVKEQTQVSSGISTLSPVSPSGTYTFPVPPLLGP